MDCFVPANDVPHFRHCEERSNPVINKVLYYFLDCFASSQ